MGSSLVSPAPEIGGRHPQDNRSRAGRQGEPQTVPGGARLMYARASRRGFGKQMSICILPRRRFGGAAPKAHEEEAMEDSVYKMVEIIGTSETSWEDAAKRAVSRANQTLRDIRIAEVVKLDMRLEDSRIVSYRARVKISFKYED